MRRVQVRKLFKRHHGSIKRVADEIGISVESVSKWLKGEIANSQRIEIAALNEAQKLLAIEAETTAVRKNVAKLAGKTAA